MEMPVDILNKELGAIRDNGDIDFDNTMAAVNIDEKLQEKFLFFPLEEIEAVEIEESRGRLHAGSGPEHCNAGEHENPAWLYNHAINALALYWRIKKDQEDREKLAKELAEAEAERQRRILIQRPIPGVYSLWTQGEHHTVIVTADRRILAPRAKSEEMIDFTDIYDELENKSRWTFTKIETGLSA